MAVSISRGMDGTHDLGRSRADSEEVRGQRGQSESERSDMSLGADTPGLHEVEVPTTMTMNITHSPEGIDVNISAKPRLDAVLGKIFKFFASQDFLKNALKLTRHALKTISPETDTEVAGKIIDGFEVVDGFGAATGFVSNLLHMGKQVVQLIASKCDDAVKKIIKIVVSAMKSLKDGSKFLLFLAKKEIIKLSESNHFIVKGANKVLKVVLSVFKIVMDAKDFINIARTIKGINANKDEDEDWKGSEVASLQGYLVQRNIANILKIAGSVTVIALAAVGFVGMFVSLAPMVIPVLLATVIVTMSVSGLYGSIVQTVGNSVSAELAQRRIQRDGDGDE